MNSYDDADYIIRVCVDRSKFWKRMEYAVTVTANDGTEIQEIGCGGNLNEALIDAGKVIRTASSVFAAI